MTMSRKHYREIAEVLAGEYAVNSAPEAKMAVRGVMLSLADVLKRDNSAFDRERFYAACNIPQYLEPLPSPASEPDDDAPERARKIGEENGRSAAEWWYQDTLGKTFADARPMALTVLAGIENGDPAVLDTLPSPDLSGEWADGYSSHDLYNEVAAKHTWHRSRMTGTVTCEVCSLLPLDADDEALPCQYGELADAYEAGFTYAVESAVVAYCQDALTVE